MENLTVGTKLIDEDRNEFIVSAVTSRIVVINRLNGTYVESVSHAFANRKYKVAAH